MIFRRIKAHIEKENWFAVGIDFFIVVVGVFVGLQVSNWNDAQTRRADERVVIYRLITEYQINLDILAEGKIRHEGVLVATNQLLSMIGPDPVRPEDETAMAETLIACLYNPVFVPRLGTTNSLISSGDIRLIGDGDIQAALTEWPARAEHVREWQIIEREHGEELILGLTYDFVAWPDMVKRLGNPGEKSRFETDYKGLLSSRRLEGLLNNRRWNTRDTIAEIETLEAETTRLLEGLKTRRGAL